MTVLPHENVCHGVFPVFPIQSVHILYIINLVYHVPMHSLPHSPFLSSSIQGRCISSTQCMRMLALHEMEGTTILLLLLMLCCYPSLIQLRVLCFLREGRREGRALCEGPHSCLHHTILSPLLFSIVFWISSIAPPNLSLSSCPPHTSSSFSPTYHLAPIFLFHRSRQAAALPEHWMGRLEARRRG